MGSYFPCTLPMCQGSCSFIVYIYFFIFSLKFLFTDKKKTKEDIEKPSNYDLSFQTNEWYGGKEISLSLMLSKIVEELLQVSSSKVLVFQILKTWGQYFFNRVRIM